MRHPFLTPAMAALLACSGSALLAQELPVAAAADPAPAPTIAYQGRLLEGVTPANGARPFVFSILDSAGAEQWSSGQLTLTVTDGLYSVVLGSTGMPALPLTLLAKAGLKLHVLLAGQALTPDATIVPAFQARSAWEVTGTFSGDLSGTQNQILIMKLQGTPIDLTTNAPTAGQALVFDGAKWVPSSVAGPTGATGPQGLPGATGATGPQGPLGLTGATGASGAKGDTGPAGVAGANGLDGRTVLSGSANPAAGVGTSGDFYLNTTASTLWGPKTGGVWPVAGVNLAGAAGPAGVAGAGGAPGAQGPLGPTGLTGAKGDAGATGATGPQGPAGSTGSTGATGSPGASPFSLNGTAAVYASGAVGIGTALAGTPAAPDASAALEVASAGKGFLAPRMTATERALIASPATALLVYQTDGTPGFYYNGGTAASPSWVGPVGTSSTTGTVTGVSGTAPVVSSGGTTPAISMAKATGSTDGYLAASDFATFAAKGSGTLTSVAALTLGTAGTNLSSTVATGTTTPVITLNVPTASASNRGALSAEDWSTFNGKQAAYTNLTGLGALANGTGWLYNNGSGTLSYSTPALATLGAQATLVSGTNLKTVGGNMLLGSGDAGTIGTGYGGTGLTAYAKGDLLVASATNTLSRLAASTDGFVLTLASGEPAWSLASASIASDANSNTKAGTSNLRVLTTGSNNTAIGLSALSTNTSGNNNTAVGLLALGKNQTGSYNTGTGVSALDVTTTGSYNVAMGYGALPSNTTGSYNTALGYLAGMNLTVGSYNIVIGHDGVAAEANTIRIGTPYSAGAGQSRTFLAGIKDVTLTGTPKAVVIDASTGQLGASTSSVGSVTSVTKASGSAITIGGTSADPTIGLDPTAVALTESQIADLTTHLAAKVATSTTVNGHALSGNITVSASDLSTGTLPHAQLPTLLAADIPNNAASTTGTAAGLANTLAVGSGGTGATTLTGVLRGNGTSAVTGGNVNLASSDVTGILPVANGGTGLTTYATGDLLVASASGTLSRLAATTDGYVLTLASGIPSWSTASASIASSVNTALYVMGIGYQALQANTSGEWSTAMGALALKLNTTGSYNTAVGKDALGANIGGHLNTAIGTHALQKNTSSNNTALGAAALSGNTTGSGNTAIGYFALLALTSGSNNIALGSDSMNLLTGTSSANAAMGNSALKNLVTGTENLALGYLAGYGDGSTALDYGSNNIYVGAKAAPSAKGTADIPIANEIVIGQGVKGHGSNTMLLGNTSNTKTFITGIRGATPAGASPQTVVIDDQGQLSSTSAPSFTGTPTAPTATIGTNTTQIATTAFVTTAVATASGPWVASSGDLSYTAGKVGVGTATPNASAALDVSSSTKGLLIPRLALTGTAAASPLDAHVAGMMVHNTATVSDVAPGFYYNTGSQWVAVSSTYTQVPTITTTPASNIAWNSLTSGGTITNTGGAAVTASGVCWNTTGSPTTTNSKTTDNVASGAFTSTVGVLSAGLVYYIRAYATNSIGTAYGNTLTVTAGSYNTATFSYTGSQQTWTVPSGVTSVILECWGAQGGGNLTGYGLGGYARGSLAVTPGQTLYVYVGQQPTVDVTYSVYHAGGWNGGGQGWSNGQSGGGASDVRVNGSGLGNRIIVAGGGGGPGGAGNSGYSGGDGGGSTGGNGLHNGSYDPGFCGGGGGQTYGGAKESTYTNGATAGSLGLGGNGGNSGNYAGGAGGGGYYGGGGGDQGSGGGGSGYIGGVTSTSMTTASRNGHGQIVISY